MLANCKTSPRIVRTDSRSYGMYQRANLSWGPWMTDASR